MAAYSDSLVLKTRHFREQALMKTKRPARIRLARHVDYTGKNSNLLEDLRRLKDSYKELFLITDSGRIGSALFRIPS